MGAHDDCETEMIAEDMRGASAGVTPRLRLVN
jgi:hypothetical protein